MKQILFYLYSLVCILITYGQEKEILFADYFDINTNKNEGSIVNGKINLKRNKDYLNERVPSTYSFKIIKSDTDIFDLKTEFDEQGRLFGLFMVAKGKNTGKQDSREYNLLVELRSEGQVLATKNIKIHVVEKTMWDHFIEFYTPITLTTPRLYGRKKIKEEDLPQLINQLLKNNGQFEFTSMYEKSILDYSKRGEIEIEWQKVSNIIGGLGYAYANSKTYGLPSGNRVNIEKLRHAIYKAVIQYADQLPVEPNDVIINGKPIGNDLGDGFSKLKDYGYLSTQIVTHQWIVTDALVAPLINIWPSVLDDISRGDEEAKKLYNSVLRFYQLFFSISTPRRAMDDNNQRWKNISKFNYSEGAWSDANIGHRMRTLMALPILWVDYNRPITYVPYWYDDYFNNTKFEGLTFAHGWSPNGVVKDLRNWCNKLSLPSHTYNQSGFHPDGTVSHHLGNNSSDVAMDAYGFEWLTTVNKAIPYFKNTPFPLKDENYQFIADRFNYTYRRMIYKDNLDYVVTGRSFFGDLSDFGSKKVAREIKILLEGKSPTTKIENEKELIELKDALKSKTHTFTGTTAFWNADYLMHRKENKETNYFFSVKHKSIRTSGAEDFSKVRKSWHTGSGVFQLMVEGDEYSTEVKSNADWHTMPGVTEEWNTTPLPKKGHASDAKPGDNLFSGILSDNEYGLTGYHHLPRDSYTAAEALKSYHLIDNYGIALGSNIQRKLHSVGKEPIVTCIDQSKFDSTLTFCLNGTVGEIKPGENTNLSEPITEPSWLHHGKKGYLIFPKNKQDLQIKTGKEINVTASDLKISKSKNFILALNHGIKPNNKEGNDYHYVLLAGVEVGDMQNALDSYLLDLKTYYLKDKYHALISNKHNLMQIVFFDSARAKLENDTWVEADKPALVMIKDLSSAIRLSVTDPMHNLESDKITLKVPFKLKPGSYEYNFSGIQQQRGENVLVTQSDKESIITINLPDKNDGSFYSYREELYAGAPIVLVLEKQM
ncbi:hypothetical protein KFZ70_09460 [Tamlana fucoidanivorans]|uniref:Silent information regulator protein Sir2 n=1 Tax=Allotamlana fucoidanivorans TaxID=2583814 RepID=A0A5C4SP20_9FLAO|nr:polysaccharide lyase family 8 super-sandwich domain-containing protein [Tamlana fucoidanivorans]TNJ46022.1 silent information regulator protein Sir2 [Tamlana fucoidanivorans]